MIRPSHHINAEARTAIAQDDGYFVVGSYTESYATFRAGGDGLSLVRMSGNGKLSLVHTLSLPNPSFIRIADDRLLYVTLETNDARAAIATVRFDSVRNRLSLVDVTPVPGLIPCHIDIDPTGCWLSCTCYGSGDVLVRATNNYTTPNKSFSAKKTHVGSSVHPIRQTQPHPHCAVFSPQGDFLLVADLGLDRVYIYPFDASFGSLGPPAIWAAPPGSGPRLLSFSADGRFVLLVSELSSEVSCLAWRSGQLLEICRESARIGDAERDNTAAGLRWNSNGRAFGVSNRGDDTIAVFWFDGQNGGITPGFHLPSGGKKPRDFEFSRSGNWLVTSNQNGDMIAAIALDVGLENFDHVCDLAVRSPSCIREL